MSKCSFGHGLKSHYLADKEHEDSAEFRKFRRNLFHGSISQILQPLRQYMEAPMLSVMATDTSDAQFLG
jgi:hypothetical protein